MIIDCHHHLSDRAGYVDELVKKCEELKIDRVCLMGLSDSEGASSNLQIKDAIDKYPDTLVGFAFIDLGTAEPDDINRFKDQGFRGLKFICPPSNYDDEKYDKIYERAGELEMVVLFHLGVVARSGRVRPNRVRNNNMRPIYLDTIARLFPELNIVGAHLGNPWYEEATMSARWNPNLYFDLTGSTLKKKNAEFLGTLLWWTPTTRYRDPEKRYAWQKIVYGSDVPCDEFEDIMNDYQKIMDELDIDKKIQEEVFGGTIARLLKL